MSADIADILDRAADLIEPEGAWTQGVLGRDEAGRVLHSWALTEARCYCLSGALMAAAGGYRGDVYRPVESLLNDHVVTWNDAPERTQSEVVAKLREAAARTRDSGRLPEGRDGTARCEASQSGAEGNRPNSTGEPQ